MVSIKFAFASGSFFFFFFSFKDVICAHAFVFSRIKFVEDLAVYNFWPEIRIYIFFIYMMYHWDGRYDLFAWFLKGSRTVLGRFTSNIFYNLGSKQLYEATLARACLKHLLVANCAFKLQPSWLVAFAICLGAVCFPFAIYYLEDKGEEQTLQETKSSSFDQIRTGRFTRSDGDIEVELIYNVQELKVVSRHCRTEIRDPD